MSSLADAEARKLVLQGSPIEPCHTCEIGLEINRNGPPPIAGVPAAIVADILELSWPVATRGDLTTYMPKKRKDNARTFLPRDISVIEEHSILGLATISTNSLVKARLYDVLSERFHHPTYRRNTVFYLLECIAVHPVKDDWTSLHDWCGRALHLACSMKDPHLATRVLEAHTSAATRVLGTAWQFAFSLFADDLALEPARYLRTAKLLSDQALSIWIGTLKLLGSYLRIAGQWTNLNFVRRSQEKLCNLARDQAAVTEARRLLVNEKLIEAEARDDVATVLIHQAMALSSNYGFTDLLDKCKTLLPVAIERASNRMTLHTHTIEVARDEISILQEIVHRAPTLETAIRTISTWPTFSMFPIDQLELVAKDALSNSIVSMFGGMTFSGNKIAHTSRGNSAESKIKEIVAQDGKLHLARIEAMLGIFLEEAFKAGVSEGTLVGSLWDAPWLGQQRRFMFMEASKHFARQDWFSAGVLFALAYEGFLRDLLRATGYPAFKYDPDGTTSDELLNSLAWGPGERLLGRPHMALVRFLLCDPSMGVNVRNEIAHSTIHNGLLSPARVFLIALLSVRLSLIDPGATDGPGEGSEFGQQD